MLANFNKYIRLISLVWIITLMVGCSNGFTNIGPGVPTDNVSVPISTEPVTTTVYKRPKIQTIFSGLHPVDFGWLPGGRIYYGIGGNPDIDSAEPITDVDETAWYGYDVANKEATRIESPRAGLHPELVRQLEHGQTTTLLTMAISPSGENTIYTRLPEGYKRPEPLPHDYVDPAEMWLAENLTGKMDERMEFPLLNDQGHLYDCGFGLSTESRWFDNETLVLGSCHYPFGVVRVYFLADLLNQTIQFLNFETNSGEYVPSEEIAIAHNSPTLAFLSDDGFWVISVESEARKIPLTLTELNFLFDDRPVVAPTWSLDDQWIYYWTFSPPSKYDENGFVVYRSWWLEKYNLFSRERKTVLSEHDLLNLMGYDMYQSPDGGGGQWRLSPDEQEILLFMDETVDNVATLFLISLSN